LKCRI